MRRNIKCKNLFNHKKLAIAFFLKNFFSFKKSLKILILRYIYDNFYFNNYRPTVRRSDTFKYSHHKSSNKSTKRILRIIDRIKEFHILQKLISINMQLLILFLFHCIQLRPIRRGVPMPNKDWLPVYE